MIVTIITISFLAALWAYLHFQSRRGFEVVIIDKYKITSPSQPGREQRLDLDWRFVDKDLGPLDPVSSFFPLPTNFTNAHLNQSKKALLQITSDGYALISLHGKQGIFLANAYYRHNMSWNEKVKALYRFATEEFKKYN